MSVRSWLKAVLWEDPALYRAAGEVNPALIVPDFQAGRPVWNTWSGDKAILEGYKSHAVVYACCRRLSLDVASVPWRLMVGENESPTHRGAKLIARPNPRFAWSDMMELLCLDLNLAGNGYWFHIPAGQTDELWRLRPDRMRIILNKDGSIQAWEHKLGSDITLLPPEQVVHFRFFDPGNDNYGMSPLQAIARTVDTDNEAINWNKASLQNRATPAGALFVKGTPTEEQIKALRETLASHSEGPVNARKTMVLGADLDWKQFGLSPQEMDFLDSLNWSARLICSAFGVHPLATGLMDATFENQKSAERSTWENTIIPFLSDQAEALDIQLGPYLGGGDCHFDYDLSQTPAIIEARKERSEEAGRYFVMGISPRAINEHLGLGFPPEDCPETGFVSATLFPVGVELPTIPTNEPPRQRSVGLHTEEQRTHHWRRFDRQRQAWERSVNEHVRGLFALEGGKVEAAVQSGAKLLDPAVNSGRNAWARTLEADWRAVVEHFGGEVADQLAGRSRDARADTWDPWKPEVQSFVTQTVGDHVVGIAEATKADLKALLQKAVESDLGTDEIAKGIRELYDGYSTGRSYTIARTEVGGAANYGSQEAARQSGVVELKEWISSRDDRVRDSHVAIDGQRRKLDQNYSNGCSAPCVGGPAGEVIQCRCAEGFLIRGEAEGDLK